MTHFTPDEMIDAAEGVLDADRRHHLEVCEPCRREVEALRGLLQEAAGIPVPEPSPLFWDGFSARVRLAVAGQPAPASTWAAWLRWSTLAPAGALAAALLVVVASLVGGPPGPMAPPLSLRPSAAASDDLLLDADVWETVADLVGPADWDAAGQAGLALTPGDTELAVLSLTEDERRELSRLLAGEIERSKS